MSEVGRAAVLDRAALLGWPEVVSVTAGSFAIEAGETSWRERLRAASQAEVREASFLLDHLAERQQAERDRIAREERMSAPPDPALAAQAEADARGEAARHAAERPARVEALLERIASAVEGLATR